MSIKQYLNADEVEKIVKDNDIWEDSPVAEDILFDLDNMEATYPDQVLEEIINAIDTIDEKDILKTKIEYIFWKYF